MPEKKSKTHDLANVKEIRDVDNCIDANKLIAEGWWLLDVCHHESPLRDGGKEMRQQFTLGRPFGDVRGVTHVHIHSNVQIPS